MFIYQFSRKKSVGLVIHNVNKITIHNVGPTFNNSTLKGYNYYQL